MNTALPVVLIFTFILMGTVLSGCAARSLPARLPIHRGPDGATGLWRRGNLGAASRKGSDCAGHSCAPRFRPQLPGMRALSRLVVAGSFVTASVAHAQEHGQHGGHDHPSEEVTEPAARAATHQMHMTGPLGLPMAREGSGTAWLPDETETRMFHTRVGPVGLMGHFNAFGGFDYQASNEGASMPLSTNWFMGMAHVDLGGGELKARTMLSLEPLTVGADGYPLLLQTGETFQGRPLVDRQHPHDLFMEAALTYTRPLGSDVALQIYGGPAGEPALGPSAFPHRQSAAADPLAPLGHHWQDSTHITFGVVTAGLMTRWAKLEGSWFNGREPDEERYDFDLRPFDSYSTRLTVNPTPRWSLQASYGFLESPEALHPDESVRRYTTSATHTARLGGGRSWATTAVLGLNQPSEGDITHGALVETSLDLDRWGITFARVEQLAKGAEEFALMGEATFSVSSLVLGHVHALPSVASIEPALGVRVSANLVDPALESRYGTRYPLGVMAYLRVAPTKMTAD